MCPNQQKIAQATALLEEVKKAPCGCGEKAEWPESGEKYFSITEYGVCEFANYNEEITYKARDFLGIFKTREEAERKLAIVKALCPASVWLPKLNFDYYFWNGKFADDQGMTDHAVDFLIIAHGNCFPKTEEGKAQCEAYGKALSDYSHGLIGKV